MVASNQFSGEQKWYTDTDTTEHITSNIGNLSLRSNYHGSNKVSVGNGTSLHISHVGPNNISTPSTSFQLRICFMCLTFQLISSLCIVSQMIITAFLFLTLLVFDFVEGRVKVVSICFQFTYFFPI